MKKRIILIIFIYLSIYITIFAQTIKSDGKVLSDGNYNRIKIEYLLINNKILKYVK